jgi:hypothetical protein
LASNTLSVHNKIKGSLASIKQPSGTHPRTHPLERSEKKRILSSLEDLKHFHIYRIQINF